MEKLANITGDYEMIYICCHLQDKNVIDFIKEKVSENKYVIFINSNSYNVIGRGGQPYKVFKDDLIKLLNYILDTNYTTVKEARQNKIYCLNASPFPNNNLVSNYYKICGYNANFNMFGFNKFNDLFKEIGFKTINGENVKVIDAIDADTAFAAIPRNFE